MTRSRHRHPFRLLLALTLLVLISSPALAEDLQKLYPATMDRSNSGLAWTCTPDDVWELNSFEFEHGKDLKIACKKSVVALGVHKTTVLWAVVFPDKPARIQTTMEGDGESAAAILLRFAPAEINRIFPKATVGKRGDPWLRAEAGRIFRHKIGWKWYTPSGNPTVVPAGVCIVDVDTREGTRRFYASDRNGGKVEYVAEFETKPVPAAKPIKKAEALEAFDAVWEAFDREYAKFIHLPRVNWDKLGKQYRKQAGKAETVFAAAAVISDMLAHLEDLHVWVRAGDDWLPGYTRERPLNASWAASLALVGTTRKAGRDLTWGRTSDGIGYVNVHGLNDPELPRHFDAALEELRDTRALVVDLRFNGGGGEDLALELAGRFVDEPRVYSTNRYRNGSKHTSLGPVLERRVKPRGPWRYESPVVALWGQKTLSSAESFALMLEQCPQVATMGDRTGGSSANPRLLDLDCGIVVNLPRWLDMDPDGNPIEGNGVKPETMLEFEEGDFTDTGDPVLEAALEHLRKK